MIWVLFIVVAILLVGGFAALLAGRLGYDPLAEATTSQADPGLGEDFAAGDLESVRFDTALRGYRMDQVDAVLDGLQDRITELEAREGAPDHAAAPARADVSADAAPARADVSAEPRGQSAP